MTASATTATATPAPSTGASSPPAEAFAARGTDAWPTVRSRLVEQHYGLVQRQATMMARQLPRGFERGDLVSYGTFGLVDALERFDASHGATFATYASHRIRGAMLDGLRAFDDVPRMVRARARRYEHASARAEQRLGRSVDRHDVASELGETLANVERLRRSHRVARNEDNVDLALVADLDADPTAPVELREEHAAVLQAMSRLPQRERDVIDRYYWRGQSLRQIGEDFGVSESRACQLHTRAVQHLRDIIV